MRNSADDGGRIERAELRDRYSAEFMAALKKLATRARHINVMQHIAGYFARALRCRLATGVGGSDRRIPYR
jgi:uncharacterized protein YbgA (DUF1722 family)